MTFRSLLKRLQKKHYPSVRAFAEALGFTDASCISRGTPFDVRGCLRLAQITGEDPTIVLRAAGKADIAALIEVLYGPSRTLLSTEQQALLTAYGQIRRADYRQAILVLVRAAAAAPSTGTAGDPEVGGGFGGPMPPVGEPPQKMSEYPRRTRTAR